METKLWYAVCCKANEGQYDTGSRDPEEAIRMALDYDDGDDLAYISVFDDHDDLYCVGEIRRDADDPALWAETDETGNIVRWHRIKNETQALYGIAGTWSVFETDTGEVYRETTREELDDLCARGYADLCRVSGSGNRALISYVPSGTYDGRKFWRKILGSWERQNTDWKRDYARIARIRDEETKEREKK